MFYTCDLCNTCFYDELLLDAHYELVHNGPENAAEDFNNAMEWNHIAFNDVTKNEEKNEDTKNEDKKKECNGVEDFVCQNLCDQCGELFSDEIILDAHREIFHTQNYIENLTESQMQTNSSGNVCVQCGEIFNDDILCEAHRQLFHNKTDFEKIDYEEPSNINHNISLNYVNQGSDSDEKQQNEVPLIQVFAESLEGKVVRHYRIQNQSTHELMSFLYQAKVIISNTLKTELNRLNCVKFNILLDATFTNVENEISHRGFIARSRSLIKTSNITDVVEECLQEIILKLTEHEARGSGWSLLETLSLDVRVHKQGYGERGSSFIPLPKRISDTKACINVQNTDNECFKYAMLTKYLLHDPHCNRPSKKYRDLFHKYNFSGISFPVSFRDVKRFEEKNIGVSVNIFSLDEKNNVYPLRISQQERRDHTDLLMVKDGDVSHYVYIKDFNCLVGRQLRNKDRHKLTVCKRCFNYTGKPFNRGGSSWLLEHTRICGQKQEVKIHLPSKEKKILNFKNVSHQYRIPFVIYADFEASLIQTNEEDSPKSNQRKMFKYQKHVPNSFCLLLKSHLNEDHLQHYGLTSKPILYRGEQAAKKFVDELYRIASNVEILNSYEVPMETLTDDQNQQYQFATTCYICQNPFTEENHKVRDHDHLTGCFRGAACNACNINYKLPKFIPVVLHNLSRYDAHFIIPELGRDDNSIDVIATTNESFISFSKKVGKMKLRFIDSFKFLSTSISKLTKSLSEDDFIETKKIVPDGKLNLITRKGVFCYDYIDSLDKFEETSLPSKNNFYNKLNEEEIDPEDYQHACRVWNELKMKTLGEYSDFYVTLDVTLLCDIMEQFRSTCFDSYGLDPLHCYTSPGLAWQAMLKETQCNLELITDIDMLLLFESGIRGGITQSVRRHVKANNKYFEDYNPKEESVYLGYFDANNLYGWAMSRSLPLGDFKWLDPKDLGDILTLPEDGNKGYILEFDFEYPDYLHDLHYDFPLFPMSEVPPNGKHKKLMTTLESKRKYVAHYLNVQQSIKLGIKITNIHRVIEFTQSYWLKPYIDSNTRRRVAAKTKFQKDFFKLMNNSIYGKSLENKRQHKNVKLVTNRKKLEKLVALPNFNTSIIINNTLTAVVLDKTMVKMDRPLYVGMCILDISKRLMYDFHYNKMVNFYGRDKIGISYTDTDSFVYWIKTEDMYNDLRTFPYKDDFDFSDYPKEHATYDGGLHKKVIGKFKDETNGTPIKEIIALAAKMYAMEIPASNNEEESTIIKKAKGIKQMFVKKNIKFEHYRRCLQETRTFVAKYNTIRSFNHAIFSITEFKKSLTPHDDKRVILENGIHTLPYGHYSLR